MKIIHVYMTIIAMITIIIMNLYNLFLHLECCQINTASSLFKCVLVNYDMSLLKIKRSKSNAK